MVLYAEEETETVLYDIRDGKNRKMSHVYIKTSQSIASQVRRVRASPMYKGACFCSVAPIERNNDSERSCCQGNKPASI